MNRRLVTQWCVCPLSLGAVVWATAGCGGHVEGASTDSGSSSPDSGALGDAIADAGLADATSEDVPPEPHFPNDFRLGGQHTCILHTGGTVTCCGTNVLGQLGDGSSVESSAVLVNVAGITRAKTLAAGWNHSCVIDADGIASCWGNNTPAGELGDGTGVARRTPVQVVGVGTIQIMGLGVARSCAGAAEGTVWCWGNNVNGALGDGTATPRRTPTVVLGLSGAVQLSGGGEHTCAVAEGGAAFCWGDNSSGELGDGTTTRSLVPISVALSNVTSISAGTGGRFTCALDTEGAAWCWGENDWGELGDSSTGHPDPRVVAVPPARDLQVGARQACVLTRDHRVFCWGRNDSYQLGTGVASTKALPAEVLGASGAVQLRVGGDHACVRMPDDTMRCWGSNNSGQLCNGSFDDAKTPVVVDFGLSE